LKKEAILLIGRGELFYDTMQGMIDTFGATHEVLVIEHSDYTYENRHRRIEIDFNTLHKDIDWDKVRWIEKELGLNLYESYSNYFYYGRLAQEANIRYSRYWRRKEELASVFLNSYELFQGIIERYDLKFAFHDTIDQIWTQVLEAFSKKYDFGFFHTLIKPGIFNNRVLLSYGIPRISPLFYNHLCTFNPITQDEKNVLNELFDRFNRTKPQLSYLKRRGQKVLDIGELKKAARNLKNLFFGAKRIINRIWLKKVSNDFSIDKAGEYILYFMAHQPEASTTSAAQRYVDQWKIIEDIAVNAPSHINIVIKDHPFGYGWHGKAYYERLIRLPNVMMAPISYDGKELIRWAKAVVTINGSVGLEAMVYDTPAYTLGDAWYAHPDYIENLTSPLELLKRLENPRVLTQKEKDRVLISVYRASVDFFVSFDPGNREKKVESGVNLARHILKNREIYFKRHAGA
jgi:hypothetical protein